MQFSHLFDCRVNMFARTELYKTILLSIGFSFALFIPVVVGAGSITLDRIAAVLIISVLSICLGQSLGRAAHLPQEPGFKSAFEIVAGFAALSILHLAVTAIFSLNAGGAIFVDAALIGIFFLTIGNRNFRKQRSKFISSQKNTCTFRSTTFDVGILLLISVVVTVWAREALGSVRYAEATGIFRVWSDFLIFAAEIKHLEDYPAFAGESLYLADVPQIFYHRASFALSAVYSWISKDPALETATFFWMPSGIILLGMAAYGFGCTLAGRAAGIASVVALFMLPDASMYWLSNGYFAFHWLIQVAPGSGYAISIALVALSAYVLGVKYSRYGFIILGAGLVLASTVLRMHIAIPMVVLFVFLVLIVWRPAKPIHRVIAVATFLFFALLTALVFERISLAPHFLSGHRDWLRYIEAVHAATPIAYEGLYAKWTAGTGTAWKALVGYALMLPAEYGVILPVMVVVIFLKRRLLSIDWRLDIVPFLMIAVHTAIIFLMPTPRHGDITDWSHRSFVLVYAVILIFSVSWIMALCKAINFNGVTTRSLGVIIGSIILAAGITVPWHYGKNIQYGSLRDGPTACATVISGDMFKATRYIRGHSRSGDVMLASDSDPQARAVALTGLQSFVSLTKYFQTWGGDLGKLATERSAANDRLRDSVAFKELAAFGRKNNIKWYLLRHEDMPAWPPQLLNHAVFRSGNMYVFDLR